MKYSQQLSILSAAIAQFDRDLPQALEGFVTPETMARLKIYRKNHFFGIYKLLKELFPVVCLHAGTDNFRFLVRRFSLDVKVTSPNIFDYARRFSKYLASCYDLHQDPLLEPLATLDLAHQRQRPQSLGTTLTLPQGTFPYWHHWLQHNQAGPLPAGEGVEQVECYILKGEPCLRLVKETACSTTTTN